MIERIMKSNSTPKILVVEDETKLANLLKKYLEAEGYQVRCFEDGSEVLDWLKSNHADLMILDLMLPGSDGIAVCREVRRYIDMPIIMATAKVEETDRLQGLEIGADDYVCKPYSLKEMVARVKAILRRTNGSVKSDMCRPEMSRPDKGGPAFEVDISKMKIRVFGEQLDLTPVEFRLLEYLINRPEIVFSRDQLLNTIYDDYRLVSDRTIDTHVKNVRKKLQGVLPQQEVIHSVYGVGYKFEYSIC
ncbi:MAG: response regulator [Motiliproteus sp.]|nr:response regulator [Motiliproteus sp.]MCW9052366.1 response regulator [Motiliproteus sp.]